MPPPIVPAPTSVGAFVGPTDEGPLDEPVACRSFADFERRFGGPSAAGPLGHAVHLFYANGGAEAVIVRVEPDHATGWLPNLLGDREAGTGLYALAASDFNLLSLAPAGPTIPVSILGEAARFCRDRRAILVADPPPAATTPEAAGEFAAAVAIAAADAAADTALYFPWLRPTDPRGPPAVAASGPVMGLIARTDAAVGVWQAPAGTGHPLRAVAGPALDLDDRGSRDLSAAGVNGIRSFAGLDTVVWDARTLAAAQAPASDWRYLPVRRTALHIEQSLHRGLQWAVFEPYDEQLWPRVAGAASEFLHGLWSQGAFRGTRPQDAFFARCDRTTMTQDDLDSGRLVVLVGFAPLRPAELVVIRIGLSRHP